MTDKLWSCLRSFTSLNHLTISDSSLSYSPSPPELPSVTSAESVTSQSYAGLLSSLPGLRRIDITIDDAERDIPQITACLRRTGGQQLTHIELTAPDSLPPEKKCVSSETMTGLGLLIREQTKNLQWLCLSRVKGTDKEDLVELVESCKHVKTINHLMLLGCGTNAHGRLRSRITGLNKSEKSLRVIALHDNGQLFVEKCQLSTEMTDKLWSCLRSFTSLNHLTISDSSLSFPPSPPELPSVTKLLSETE
ncbi:uncharacterized protein LOC100888566 [Strongylocentrotus purpuratus]|uniref:Uncharacterized protein n=1 Tax=Strongylocentrotus purpuratus TaxID=7668 RepID=A0A7M7PE81_STRPU|nr:uncharacterized protein LOC100888566 [Strongylocentrotus purpuratus]